MLVAGSSASCAAAAHCCGSGLLAGVGDSLKRRGGGGHDAPADGDCATRDQASPTAYAALSTLPPANGRCSELFKRVLGPTQMETSSPGREPGSRLAVLLQYHHHPAPEFHRPRAPVAPYRAFTSLLRTEIKLQGVEPEDISPGFVQRIAHAVSGEGACGLAHGQGRGQQAPGAGAGGGKHLQLEAVYVRRGCVELVVDVRVWAGGEGEGAGEAARGGERDGGQHGAGRADGAGQPAMQAAEGACTATTALGAGPAGGGARMEAFLRDSASPLQQQQQQQQQEHARLLLQQRWQHRSFPSCTTSLTPLTASPSASEGGEPSRATCGGVSSGSSCRSAIDVGLLIRALQLPHEAAVDYAHLYPLSGAGVLAPAAGHQHSPWVPPACGGEAGGRGATASGVEGEGQVAGGLEVGMGRQRVVVELVPEAAMQLRPGHGGGGGMGPQGLGAEGGGHAERTVAGPETLQAPPQLVGAGLGERRDWQQQQQPQQRQQGLAHGDSGTGAGAFLHGMQPAPPPPAPPPSAFEGWHPGAAAATSATAAAAVAAAAAAAEVTAGAGGAGAAGLVMAWRVIGPRVLALPPPETQRVVTPPPVAHPDAVGPASGASIAVAEPQPVHTATEQLDGRVLPGETAPSPLARRTTYNPGLMLPHGRPPLPLLQQQQQVQPLAVGQEELPHGLPVVAQLKAEVELGALVAGPAGPGWTGAGAGPGLWAGPEAGLEVVVRSQGRCLPVSVVWHDGDGEAEDGEEGEAGAGAGVRGRLGHGHAVGPLQGTAAGPSPLHAELGALGGGGCGNGSEEDETPSAGLSWSSVDSVGGPMVPGPAPAAAVAPAATALASSNAATAIRGLQPPQLHASRSEYHPPPAQPPDPALAATPVGHGPDRQPSPRHIRQLLASRSAGALAATAVGATAAAAADGDGADSPIDSRAPRDTGSGSQTPAITGPQPTSLHTYRRRCTILLHAMPPLPGLLLVEIAPTRMGPSSHPSSEPIPTVTIPDPATQTTLTPPLSATPPHPHASASPLLPAIREATPASISISTAAAAASLAAAAGAVRSSLPAPSMAYLAPAPRDGSAAASYLASSPREGPASVAPVLLLADPRVAVELQALCDTWQGGEGHLRDMLLDLGCFLHHAHRYGGRRAGAWKHWAASAWLKGAWELPVRDRAHGPWCHCHGPLRRVANSGIPSVPACVP